MKSKILFMTMLACASLAVTSCDDDTTEGMTRITYYPTITILGESEITMKVGEEYTDEGCQVIMNGEDVTDQVITDSDVDTSTPGIYSVTYTAFNADGFSKSASRTVKVINPGNFSTLYLGESEYGARHYNGALTQILPYQGNIYYIDDLSAGFYWYGRYAGYEAYGYDFHLEAYLQLNDDNSLELYYCDPAQWYWGIGMTLTSGHFDPTTGEVVMELDFDGVPFYVNLHPIVE